MQTQELHKKLDILKEALPNYNLVHFKFMKDIEYDYALLDWFADGGEIRTYKSKSNYKGAKVTYPISLHKGDVALHIGSIWDMSDEVRDPDSFRDWVDAYVSYFWSKNQTLKFCTSNLLETVEEIFSKDGCTKINETTYSHRDGSFSENNVFHLSKDTIKTIAKSAADCKRLLDFNLANYEYKKVNFSKHSSKSLYQ